MRQAAAAAILPLVRRSSGRSASSSVVVRRGRLSSVASQQTAYDDPASTVVTASPAVVAKVANGLAVASSSSTNQQRKVEIAKLEEEHEVAPHPTPAQFPKAATSDPKLHHEGSEEGREEEKTSFVSPDHVTYAGGVDLPITSDLEIVLPERDVAHPWPVFRLIDEDGSIRPSIPLDSPLLTEDVLYDPPTALRAHRTMIRLTQMDHILQNAQRQGRISFYMSCRGEESIHVGSAANLTLRDPVLAQYREAGVLMWRGFTLEQFADQCFSNCRDLGRGRQMPVHYGCRALNYHTISSPLGTQIPQAVGVAYKLKLDNMEAATSEDPKACAVTYFGDGAASTGDFHTACNFAATLEVPVIFFCRNNGYAISTPTHEQYRGDGIIGRAPGYGMAAVRVDGNDILAVSAVMRAAREYAIRESKPIMIEAMTYRQSHHSTSDDSTRYRSVDEIRKWEEGGSDPVVRWRRFLTKQGWMVDEEEHTRMADEERMEVLRAMELAENKAKPDLSTLFEDVYVDKPKHLERQEREHLEHVARHKSYYDADHH